MEVPTPQPLARPAHVPQAVTFTQAQLDWLDQQFPEPIYMVGSDEKAHMVKSIQRGVVHEVRRRLAKSGGLG